jgi:hypothetical protein
MRLGARKDEAIRELTTVDGTADMEWKMVRFLNAR